MLIFLKIKKYKEIKTKEKKKFTYSFNGKIKLINREKKEISIIPFKDVS